MDGIRNEDIWTNLIIYFIPEFDGIPLKFKIYHVTIQILHEITIDFESTNYKFGLLITNRYHQHTKYFKILVDITYNFRKFKL